MFGASKLILNGSILYQWRIPYLSHKINYTKIKFHNSLRKFSFFTFTSIFDVWYIKNTCKRLVHQKYLDESVNYCDSETSQQRTSQIVACLEQRTKGLVPNVTIFVKLPPNSGHLLITDRYFFKTRTRPLFRGFTILLLLLLLLLLLFSYFTFLFLIRLFFPVVFVQTLYCYSFSGNNMYVPGDDNILLICAWDL